MSGECLDRLYDVWNVSGRSLEEGCLEGNWKLSVGGLGGVWVNLDFSLK